MAPLAHLLLAALLLGTALAVHDDCHSKKTRKSTAKLIKEMPFLGLFRDTRNQSVFEGSDIALVRGKYYVVFDSSYSVGVLDDRFQFRDPVNKLVGARGRNDSQFEGIAYVPEDDSFLLLQEAIEHKGDYKPFVISARLDVDKGSYEPTDKCEVDFTLTHENKGFEGILYLKNSKGAYLLGLCEGNYCTGGREGRAAGNGRIVVLTLDKGSNSGGCRWVKETVLKLPRSVRFVDYSGIALDYKTGRLAILSQEDSAFWVGHFDIETLEFLDDGVVISLPRNDHCEVTYCNAEGIQWIDENRVIIVSDKAKSKQPYRCDQKDQSVHIFALPPAAYGGGLTLREPAVA